MKKLFLILFLFSGLLACKKNDSFLENKTTALDEAQVFSDSARTMAFLTRIYADLSFSFTKGRWDSHGNTEQATDDAEYTYSGVGQKAVILYNGTVSPLNFPFGEFWSTPYANVRRVNLLLAKLPSTPISQAVQTRMKGEARFLRAYFYHHLLITFGGFPIVGDQVFGINDIINLPRNTIAECVDYIVKDLDSAGMYLRDSTTGYEDNEWGRASKGMCMGLKSRVLLYAASPLFNAAKPYYDSIPGASVSGAVRNIAAYGDYKVERWQAAATAAEAVINSGYFSLYDSTSAAVPAGFGFYYVFLKRNLLENREYIIPFQRGANRDMEVFYNPPSRSGQKNSMPTQNLVDAFPMKNGKAITDPTSGYSATNPYANRDPRFRYSIIFNGSFYQNGTSGRQAVFTYNGAATDGFGATTTGYYSRKMCDSAVANNSGGNTDRSWPLMRYAEIILNYAEALTELDRTEDAVVQIKKLRARAGIDAGSDNRYGIKSGISKVEMRNLVRNERRIELAFEDQRWFDIRRWLIAMQTNNQYNKCMKITRSGTSPNFVYTYEIVESVRRHNFRPEMYLLPIPDAEIRKMPAMVQNPGW